MERKYLLLIILLLGFAISKGQSVQFVLTSAGSYVTNSNAHYNWSLGECITGSNDVFLGSISQGFIIVSSKTKNLFVSEWNFSIYPNPTSDRIVLSIENLPAHKVCFELYDLTGKPLKKGIITETITEVSFKEYKSAPYILKVMEDNTTISTYKIIKK